MEYQLEIKQIVDYPRCRIHREFIRNLMEDRNLRTNGESYLFYYMVLYSFANFRSSYKKYEGTSYTIAPGEWICSPAELSSWFRTRYQHQAISILETLEQQSLIEFSKIHRDSLIKFRIIDWKKSNPFFEYNYPCQKDTGFFFFPIAAVSELISTGKCSDMDIVLDLWIHGIYQDEKVDGSDVGPVVYFRNGSGNPRCCYSNLAKRWSSSKATVSRTLNKLAENEYISIITFPGTHGSVIYLNNYLSTMFHVSDVLIDKEEVYMAFKIPFYVSEFNTKNSEEFAIKEEQIFVSAPENSVSKTHLKTAVEKVAETLATQGVACCECPNAIYKLYSLSDCEVNYYSYSLTIQCPDQEHSYHFELKLTPSPRNWWEDSATPLPQSEKQSVPEV